MRLPALLLALAFAPGLPPAASAEDPAVPAAEQAAENLRGAIEALNSAHGSRDRVAALTRTIQAYEDGLASLRDTLRRASLREAEIAADFDAKRDRIGQLLGVMSAMERDSAPLLLLHPDGPVGAARSGMILSAVAPALETEADALAAQLAELAHLRQLQSETAEMLAKGLAGAQGARTALSKAIQDRTDLPQRFLDDPEEVTALVASADSLDAFANGLAAMETDIGAPMDDFAGAKGALPLPVRGTLLRGAGAADAAGIRRPGILVETSPGALVTAPWPATIRYRGPLLDYGNVMIVEPASGYLLVLAGLGTVYGDTGDVLEAGAPIGLMGGAAPGEGLTDAESKETGGEVRTETLYIELRQGKEPVDPGPWFIETRKD
ncbi:peptidoglycan DD-metalloendopeptidase family protein [Defluviimonas sp. WL0024]|uniref:Peptidoglycan DD-metalloendopeptidase family protein n=2 Tax=Albidovulum TaxID=205889 RepID=A0ABT3IZ08_9RHOB|nr:MULTISPECIES: peptidoglycan DD-metalloendopeptidase family protein [Defluviimonas]MCU9848351.1 peptidoglycan DD-metalloendopeptidase family protein [Defluviimonas sp. WL0024]MCW3780663.1 peptidoglycan DD-metalloendopeptidase family protein [Defluviimonas salinarum]